MSHRLARAIAPVVLTAALGGSLLAPAAPASAEPRPKYKSFVAYRLTNAGLHAGQKARFAIKVSGPVGTPTGTVQLLQEGRLLGSAKVRTNGRAVLRSYALPRGTYHVRIRYSGDQVYAAARTRRLLFGVS